MTDGVAIVNTNNVAPLLRRVVDDLSSYYLMTYSSTNSKLDGRFRSISVRVSRPGVQTRARRGYRALTAGRGARDDQRRRRRRRRVPPAQSGGARGAQRDGVQPARRAAAARRRPTPPAGQGAFWLVGTLDDATRRGCRSGPRAPRPTSPCARATAARC